MIWKRMNNTEAKKIVEGIEKKEDLLRIISLNPDFIQGYYYSKPISGFEYIQNIKTNQLLN